MSCESLKKLPRKRVNRPSSDFCCADAWVAKARTKTVAISTTRMNTAATNDRYATKKNASTSVERSVTTFPEKQKQTDLSDIAAPDLSSMRMTVPPHTRRITYETAIGRDACVERI